MSLRTVALLVKNCHTLIICQTKMAIIGTMTMLEGRYPGQNIREKNCFERYKERDGNRNEKTRSTVPNNLEIGESSCLGVETNTESEVLCSCETKRGTPLFRLTNSFTPFCLFLVFLKQLFNKLANDCYRLLRS